MFPLVSSTNQTCGFFQHRFIQVILALPCSTVYFNKIFRFLRIFDNSIIEDCKLLYTISSDCYGLENSVVLLIVLT